MEYPESAELPFEIINWFAEPPVPSQYTHASMVTLLVAVEITPAASSTAVPLKFCAYGLHEEAPLENTVAEPKHTGLGVTEKVAEGNTFTVTLTVVLTALQPDAPLPSVNVRE
jgi:hypothetical protein